MITVNVHTQIMMSNRMDITCPACGLKEAFYFSCPEECTTCKTPYPDVKALVDDLPIRILWHFFNEDK